MQLARITSPFKMNTKVELQKELISTRKQPSCKKWCSSIRQGKKVVKSSQELAVVIE